MLYVDDGFVGASKSKSIKEFLNGLQDEFRIKTEPVGCFFGVLVLIKYYTENASPVSTPIERRRAEW